MLVGADSNKKNPANPGIQLPVQGGFKKWDSLDVKKSKRLERIPEILPGPMAS
jgi:hypothetical protein